MSKSTNLPKWVNTQDQGQVQRAIYVAELRLPLINQAEYLSQSYHFKKYQDTTLNPVERLIWGVTYLAVIMDTIRDTYPEMQGAVGLSEVLIRELASNLQEWVITGNDDLIQIDLEMCDVALKELDRVLDEQTETQQ